MLARDAPTSLIDGAYVFSVPSIGLSSFSVFVRAAGDAPAEISPGGGGAGKRDPVLSLTYAPSGTPRMGLKQVQPFCFPYHASADVAIRRQQFTFALTGDSGSLLFGFCLQVGKSSRRRPPSST